MMHAYCIIFVSQLLSISGAMESSIVGGRVAKPHSRRYMASLQVRGHHTCGGILIREDFILTAAHCRQDEQLTVVLGAHDITKKEKSQQRIEVKQHYPHPKYKGQYDNDLMLLKLKKNARLDKYVKPIGLPKKDKKILANITCEVAGWGLTGDNRVVSDVLREATEKMQFSFECKYIWGEYFKSEHMICTAFTKKKGGVCQGDSGGPLICNTKLYGITAFTREEDCNNPKYPHVFTKVHAFLPWIKEVMQGLGDAE
ncbi:granzyme B-like [Scomber japonicus]|uniref:granzyme B-like n=1 Tax=Scomber japonicus TaxID=13676 RepID=UPI002306B596|nr:granzyme B-like [Scomber japonicus]